MFINEFNNLKEKVGCNMTEEGRSCPEHGIMECPGYKMIETAAGDKLYQRHQELRKKSGLPNPNYYKELKSTFDLPDDERRMAVAALKKKYKVEDAAPDTRSDAQKYMQTDRGASAPKTNTEKPIDVKPAQEPKSKKDPKEYMIKSVGEDAIDDRLTAQYSTPLAKAKTQAIDQAFASGQQSDFDRLGIMSPQQIERDYQAMRAKEPAQDAALMKNPALTPGARTQTFKTNPKGVPIREHEVNEAGPFGYGAKKPRKGSVADLAAQKRKEQERGRQPIEPKDQRVGVAQVVKDVAEGSDNITAIFSGYGNYMSGRGSNVFKHYGITVLDKQYLEDEDIAEYTVSGSKEALDQARAYLERSDQFGGMIIKQGVAEGVEQYLEELSRAGYEVITETAELCPECGGPAFSDQLLAEKKDACYSKVKSRYKVWPSAYASGALVRCRKVGAKNWGNKSKK